MTGFKNSLLPFLGFLSLISPAGAEQVLVDTLKSAYSAEFLYSVPEVQMKPMETLKIDSYGLYLPTEDDPLEPDIWENSKQSDIEEKILKTEKGFFPPTAEKLRHSLITMTAEPPESETDGRFLSARLSDLFQRGDFKSVRQLIQRIPQRKLTEQIVSLQVNVSLLLSDTPTACRQLSFGYDGVSFQKLGILCAAIEKNENKASLGLELLKEQGVEDPFFTDAVNSLLSNKPLSQEPSELTPFNFFIVRLFGKSIPEKWTETKEIWAWKAFAQSDSTPYKERIVYAEKLAQNGLIAPQEMLDLYLLQKLPDTHSDEGPLLRAYAVQKANGAFMNKTKVEHLSNAFASAQKDKVFTATALSVKNILSSISFEEKMQSNASLLIKAFALNGQNEKVAEWIVKALKNVPISETSANGWYMLDFVDQSDESFHIPEIEKMMAYHEEHKTQEYDLVLEIDRLMLLFEVLGFSHPDETWIYSSFDSKSAESLFVEMLHFDGKKQNVSEGEQILDALADIQTGYAGLLRGIRTLQKIGLSTHARQIALEAITPDILSLE